MSEARLLRRSVATLGAVEQSAKFLLHATSFANGHLALSPRVELSSSVQFADFSVLSSIQKAGAMVWGFR